MLASLGHLVCSSFRREKTERQNDTNQPPHKERQILWDKEEVSSNILKPEFDMTVNINWPIAHIVLGVEPETLLTHIVRGGAGVTSVEAPTALRVRVEARFTTNTAKV